MYEQIYRFVDFNKFPGEKMVPKIIAFAVYGIFLGIVTIPLAKKMTLSRTEDPGVVAPLNKTPLRLLTVVLGLAAAAGIVFSTSKDVVIIQYMLLLVPIFSIAFVDALVRKIPNPLLLAMLIVDIGFLIYNCVLDKNANDIVNRIFGFIISFGFGFIVCLLPSLLKIPMGAGDIKYSAVIGATLGMLGYFQAMVLMALLVALFWIILKITKKGNIKTQVPMGPFLSIGTVITMCFPIGNYVNQISLF